MHYPKSASVSIRMEIFECNFTKFSWVILWKHPQKYSLWVACRKLMSSTPYYRLNFIFWQNLFSTLLNATTAYIVTNSDLWPGPDEPLGKPGKCPGPRAWISKHSFCYFLSPTTLPASTRWFVLHGRKVSPFYKLLSRPMIDPLCLSWLSHEYSTQLTAS